MGIEAPHYFLVPIEPSTLAWYDLRLNSFYLSDAKWLPTITFMKQDMCHINNIPLSNECQGHLHST